MTKDETEIIIMALESEAPTMVEWDNIFFTGIGKVNATMLLTELLVNYPNISKVWNFGTAGGITVEKGIHKCTTFLQRDMLCEPMGYKTGQTPWEDEIEIVMGDDGLTCSSGDNFVTNPRDPMLGDIVDMEAYALAKVCKRMNVEFECWKFITDCADDDSPETWHKNVTKGEEHFIRIFNNG